MGKVDPNSPETTETVESTSAAAEVSKVKTSDLQKFYDQGHSPQETADEFDVEVTDVVRVLGLDKQGEDLDEFNQPRK